MLLSLCFVNNYRNIFLRQWTAGGWPRVLIETCKQIVTITRATDHAEPRFVVRAFCDDWLEGSEVGEEEIQ